jgi:hypothetical protein
MSTCLLKVEAFVCREYIIPYQLEWCSYMLPATSSYVSTFYL